VYNPNVAEFKLIGVQDGQTIMNRIYLYSPQEDWGQAKLTEVAGFIGSWLSVTLAPNVSHDMTWNSIIGTSMEGKNSAQVVVPFVSPVSGTHTSGAAPNNVALCISLKTGSRGRSARGRFYLSGVPAAAITRSMAHAEWRDSVQDAFQTLVDDFQTEQAVQLCVYSTMVDKQPRATGLPFPVLFAVVNDDVLDSQRRRLPNRGI